MSTKPFCIELEQARVVLAEMGIELTARQMKRAAETDATAAKSFLCLSIPSKERWKSRLEL